MSTAATPPSVAAESAVIPCPNCGADVAEAFCPRCGQERTHLGASVRELARDFFDEHVGVDSKVLRTLARLFSPGALTIDYLEGRRTRFVRPLRLYLSISVVFFIAMSLPQLGARSVVDVHTTSTSAPGAGEWRAQSASTVPPKAAPGDWYTARKHSRLARFAGMTDAERSAELSRLLLLYLPKTVFVLLPIFALLVQLVSRGQRNCADHFVFALHVHAFAFLLLSLSLTPRFLWPTFHGPLVAQLVVAVYLVAALRRVYGQSWPRAIAKTALLSIAYLLVFAVATVVTLGYAVLIA